VKVVKSSQLKDPHLTPEYQQLSKNSEPSSSHKGAHLVIIC